MTEAQFEQLFREQFNSLANMAYTVVKDIDEARDIVQQVFMNVWQNRNTTIIRGSAGGYLYRAVLNTALTRLSGLKRNTRLELAGEVLQCDKTEDDDRTEIIEKVQKAINELPPVCQHVFRLSRFSDLSNKEIADGLGISVKAVEKHITRAFKYLRGECKNLVIMMVGLLASCLSFIKYLP